MSTKALCFTLIAALASCACGQGGGGEGGVGTVTPDPVVDQSGRSCLVQLKPATSSSGHRGVQPVVDKHQTVLLLLVGFGGFSLLLALLHNALRRHVFHDRSNLDTTFDAGGNVSLSLTAVTVACQLFWPVDLLYTATLTVKLGISGPFWYSVSLLMNIFIFPIASVHFKTIAPGAKTYLQIIRARFGQRAHIVMCLFALMVNLVVIVDIMLAGKAAIQSLTQDASDELCLLLMVTLFGSYSLVGGLGTTFYVSYFNACIVYVLLIVFMVKILHSDDARWEGIGDLGRIHEAISCLQGPEGNVDRSFFTFRSTRAVMYGVLGTLGVTSLTYCDQASWQSRLAAKPVQGVVGFLLAGLIWFSIPNVMAITTGLAYLVLSSQHNATHLLTAAHIDEGLVTPLIAEMVLGSTGGFLLLTMVAMALMSTGSGEVMALSSIIVYDIYQPYIRPFRKGLETIHCVLCGKPKKELASTRSGSSGDVSVCMCVSADGCPACIHDLAAARNAQSDFSQTKTYSCPTHGPFRHYMDYLLGFKNWCIVMVALAILPLGMAVFQTGIDLVWMFYMGVVLTLPCFAPVLLGIVWVKTTAAGVIVGGLGGLIGGVGALLVTAATLYEGGLDNFLINTTQDYSLICGTMCALGLSVVGCVLVSLLTHRIRTEEDEEREWMKLFCIDNPLHPWEANYRQELKDFDYQGRPSMGQMKAAFRHATLSSYIGGGCCIGVFTVLLPAVLSSVDVLDQTHFSYWMVFSQAWAILMALVVVLAPPVQEVVRILRQCRQNRHELRINVRNQETSDLAAKDSDHHHDNSGLMILNGCDSQGDQSTDF